MDDLLEKNIERNRSKQDSSGLHNLDSINLFFNNLVKDKYITSDLLKDILFKLEDPSIKNKSYFEYNRILFKYMANLSNRYKKTYPYIKEEKDDLKFDFNKRTIKSKDEEVNKLNYSEYLDELDKIPFYLKRCLRRDIIRNTMLRITDTMKHEIKLKNKDKDSDYYRAYLNLENLLNLCFRLNEENNERNIFCRLFFSNPDKFVDYFESPYSAYDNKVSDIKKCAEYFMKEYKNSKIENFMNEDDFYEEEISDSEDDKVNVVNINDFENDMGFYKDEDKSSLIYDECDESENLILSNNFNKVDYEEVLHNMYSDYEKINLNKDENKSKDLTAEEVEKIVENIIILYNVGIGYLLSWIDAEKQYKLKDFFESVSLGYFANAPSNYIFHYLCFYQDKKDIRYVINYYSFMEMKCFEKNLINRKRILENLKKNNYDSRMKEKYDKTLKELDERIKKTNTFIKIINEIIDFSANIDLEKDPQLLEYLFGE